MLFAVPVRALSESESCHFCKVWAKDEKPGQPLGKNWKNI